VLQDSSLLNSWGKDTKRTLTCCSARSIVSPMVALYQVEKWQGILERHELVSPLHKISQARDLDEADR